MPVVLFHKGQAFLDDGQGSQAKEVHLEHSHLFYVGALVLGNPHLLVRGFIAVQFDGDIISKVSAADDHGAGVDARLADAALKLKGVFQHLFYLIGAVFHLVTKFRDVLDTVFQVGLHLLFLTVLLYGEGAVRYHLGQTVALVKRQAADARHVLDGALGGHRAEGDNVGDMVHAVFLLHVLDNAVAAFVVKVHVDIRHGYTLRVEETLEQEVVPDRVQVGDAQAVSHGASGGASTTRTYGNTVVLGPVDEVLYNQEVVREAHSAYGLELEVQTLCLLFVKLFSVAYVRAVIGQFAHVGHGAVELLAARIALLVVAAGINYILVLVCPIVNLVKEVLREFEFGQYVPAVYGVAFNLVQDLHRVGDGLRMLREKGQHFFFTLQVLLLGVAKTVRFVYESVCGKADEPVMGRPILLAHKVNVIGSNYLYAVFLCQPEYYLCILLLLFPGFLAKARNLCLVQHNLKVIIFSEDLFMPFYSVGSPFKVSRQNVLRHFSHHAGR